MHCLTRSDIEKMEKVPRLKLVNALPGFKSANLLGTVNGNGVENLAVFSSVIHIGSNPPLLGFMLRPTTVPRHTYDNIRDNDGWYTVNHIHREIFERAHQTSGNYRADLSEFEQCGLASWYSDTCPAPYVREARIRIGMKMVEEHLVLANETRLIVGSVEEVWIPDSPDGEEYSLDLEQAGTVAISGVDGYHETRRIDRLGYVRVDDTLKRPGL
ncbi:MAG: flavin reductase [Balneolaceae bacterium]|nr:flavin reductase [Balneolaceae bacterium]